MHDADAIKILSGNNCCSRWLKGKKVRQQSLFVTSCDSYLLCWIKNLLEFWELDEKTVAQRELKAYLAQTASRKTLKIYLPQKALKIGSLPKLLAYTFLASHSSLIYFHLNISIKISPWDTLAPNSDLTAAKSGIDRALCVILHLLLPFLLCLLCKFTYNKKGEPDPELYSTFTSFVL